MRCFTGVNEEEKCLDLSELTVILLILHLIKEVKIILVLVEKNNREIAKIT